jgi:hypothetical protein
MAEGREPVGVEAQPPLTERESPPVRPGELETVRQVFVTFAKTAKTIQLYPSNNKLFIAAVAELLATYTEFLARFGELTVDVEETRLLYLGRPMYEEPARTRSIPWRLHCDGVRRLVFLPGVTEPELLTLLEILGNPPSVDDPEDDIVTRLWEKELPHIHYFVIDPDTGADDQPPDLSRDLKHGESEVEPHPAEAGSGGPVPEDPRPKRTLPQMAPATMGRILTITDQDRRVLAEMIDHDRQRDLRQDLTSLLFELLSQHSDEDAFQNTVGVLGLLLRSFLEAGDISAATDVLRRLRQVVDSDAQESLRGVVRSQIELCSGPDTVGLIVKALGKGGSSTLEDAAGFVELLDPAAGPAFVELLPHADDPRFLEFLVRRILASSPERLRERLDNRDSALVRRIVAAIGAIGDPRYAEWLVPLLLNRELPVRLEALQALGRVGGGTAKEGLLSALGNSEVQVRKQALRTIREQHDTSLLPRLIRYATSKESSGRDQSELQELYRTIAVTGREAALAWLVTVVDRRPLLRIFEKTDRRAAAAWSLGFVGGQRARKAITERIPATRGQVQEALRAALRRLDDGSGPEEGGGDP